MKAIFIAFNQAHYDNVITALEKLNLRGFTYWETVQGRGTNSGEPHYGDHAWPTLNSAVLTIIPAEKTDATLTALKRLDTEKPQLGLRAFVWRIEKTI